MTRSWKLWLGIAAFVIGLNVALAVLHSLTGGTPGGPPSSSYSTASDGVAAYASLLARTGHPIDRVASRPGRAKLDPASTVILLDSGGPVSDSDATALEGFVAAGGRLVMGGATGSWLNRIVPDAPGWSPSSPETLEALAPAGELAQVRRLDVPGFGSWEGGSALPLLGDRNGALLSLATVGSGSVMLLANSAPLQNNRLDHDDDAALGIALAGPATRPVIFLEGYHGYGSSSGFDAVPGRWWDAFGLLALAALVLMLASGRRFGPPQAAERKLPPPRWEYVESLGGVLARSRPHEAAIQPVRKRIRRLVGERGGLGETPSDDQIRAAALRLGIPEHDADLLARPANTDADVLALGRVLARVERESRR